MTQPEEPPRGLAEEPAGIMPEKLDTVRDALRTMTRGRRKGGAVT